MSHWRSLGEAEDGEREARRREPLSTRVRVHMRDGWRCCACGCHVREVGPQVTALPPDAATLDHRIPVAAGGKALAHNLQTMCSRCNGRKGDSLEATPEEAQLAELLGAPGGYVSGVVLRLGATPSGAQAWLSWPEAVSRGFEPAYHRQRDPRRDPAEPLRVRLELLTGWDRFGWRRHQRRQEADDATDDPESPFEGPACAQ